MTVTEIEELRKDHARRAQEGNLAKTAAERLLDDHATANLTLEEVKARDIDNFHLLLASKGCKDLIFEHLKDAIVFHGQAMARCMGKLGCKTLYEHSKRTPKALTRSEMTFYTLKVEKEMQRNDVVVERRESKAYPEPNDFYKRGFYIYHGREIVFFISSPRMIEARSQGGIVMAGKIMYMVQTNAPDNVD